MLIGLISDTHIPNHAKELPAQLKEVFRGVDLILHAGDIYNIATLDELECIAPVLAARGDDDPLVVMGDKRVEWKHTLRVEGVTIWLSHQYGIFSWEEHEKPPDVKVIVYGHTHEAALIYHAGTLRVNPGSPTFPRYKLELGTVGLLTVGSGKAEAQIIYLVEAGGNFLSCSTSLYLPGTGNVFTTSSLRRDD
ncbi:metallophosphoesterase family protein [Chloroflexota bacterium]